MTTKDKSILDDHSRSLFMKLYQFHTVLWDKTHVHYKDYAVRQLAYEAIAERMQIDGLTPEKVVKSYHNMQTTYGKLKKQGKLSATNLANCKDWVVIMDSFMGDERKCPNTSADHNLPVNSCMRMQLLECYRDQAVLWHPQHPNYKHTYHRDQAWSTCARKVGISIEQCRKLVHNMRTLYVKKRKLQSTGPFSADEKSNLWLTAMDVFLGPVLFPSVDEVHTYYEKEVEETEFEVEDIFEDAGCEEILYEDDKNEKNILEEICEQLTCRCCLRQCDEEDVKSLDMSFRDGIVYAQIYKDCIGYNHTDSDQLLVSHICRACEKLLMDLYEFKKQCRNNEDAYLATQTYSAVQEVAMVDLKIERLESSEDLVVQEIEISEDTHYEEVTEVVEEPEETSFVCQFCGKSFTSEGFLNNHTNSVHAAPIPQLPYDFEGRKPLSCPHCQQEFKAGRYLKRHFQFSCTKNPNFDRSKLPVCPICGKQVTRLSVHMKTHRTPTADERYQCSMCERSFKSKLYLDGHVKHSHFNHTYKCQFCEATFKSWNGKRNHVRQKHLDIRPYQCEAPGCNRNFLQLSQLNYHKRQAHSSEPAPVFMCDICDVKFSKKETLKVHHEAKHSGQPVNCEVCNKTFACKKLLKNHAVLHTGEKNYKCPMCDPPVAFAQNHVLRNHCAKMHPDYQMPPKGTVVSAKALERRARQEAIDKTLVKISMEDFVQYQL